MRLLKLGIYHPTYLRDFYERQPGLRESPYAVQHRTLIDDCYGSSDFWTHALAKLGYETDEIIANAESLQKRWAGENDVAFDDRDRLFEIAAAQIKKFRPDILLIADYSTFSVDFIRSVRRECPSIRLVIGWCGAPYNDPSIFREWDIALSCVPELVADFRAKGLNSHHVNHAFDARVLSRIDKDAARDCDFAFIGSIVKQNRFHLERERLLVHLIEHTNLQIWSDIERTVNEASSPDRPSVPERFLKALRRLKNGKPAEPARKPSSEIDGRIARRSRPALFGVDMFRQLHNSRIVFNNHIDISRSSASNMRLFETTGVGACLLTDWRENLSEMFEPDVEVLTYRSVEECVEKVNYILGNEAERRSIATAGQRRTLRDHNFDNRIARVHEIINASI